MQIVEKKIQDITPEFLRKKGELMKEFMVKHAEVIEFKLGLECKLLEVTDKGIIDSITLSYRNTVINDIDFIEYLKIKNNNSFVYLLQGQFPFDKPVKISHDKLVEFFDFYVNHELLLETLTINNTEQVNSYFHRHSVKKEQPKPVENKIELTDQPSKRLWNLRLDMSYLTYRIIPILNDMGVK